MNEPLNGLDVPDIALIAITRVALGVGFGLLLAHRLSDAHRVAAGWSLLTIGIVTTIPLGVEVFSGRNHREAPRARPAPELGTSE